MLPDLDPKSPIPLYVQIVEHVRRLVAIGALKPGERFLTVRELGSRNQWSAGLGLSYTFRVKR